jgi:hypothetical protein
MLSAITDANKEILFITLPPEIFDLLGSESTSLKGTEGDFVI